jgi:glyoxylase-like metal-dependent hydrolase (beta-lactamase superfamily II)
MLGLTTKASQKSLSTFSRNVTRIRIGGIVNAYFVDTPKDKLGSWVLIDTGTPKSAKKIVSLASERYGKESCPTAIILTHGHFDHAGSAYELSLTWNVPVFAHYLEMPYLTGKSKYPPQDPNVEGAGAFGFMSRFFTREPFDLKDRIYELPDDGEVPGMSDWEYYHTPGHTAGHISLFRYSDGTLLAGDAITTVNQDSVYSLMTEKPEFYRPPAYFTSDWKAACDSIKFLASLEPNAVGAGHGTPITGVDTSRDFDIFADSFHSPRTGRYADAPAITDETGVIAVPPPTPDPLKRVVAGTAVAIAAGAVIAAITRRKNKQR